MNLDSLAKLIDYDIEQGILVFKVPAMDESQMKKIEKFLQDDRLQKLKLLSQKKEYDPSDEQIGKFWAVIGEILRHQRLPVNAKTTNKLYRDLQHNYFPVDQYVSEKQPDGMYKRVPIKKSLSDLSKDELSEIINDLILDYTDIGVDFERYKQRYN